MCDDAPQDSLSFTRLDERIQRWIWQNEWTELRDIQEKSIPLLLEHQQDVILSATTASGKTEAAFLPILTFMLARKEALGLALYISPLAALINDQFQRLDVLCERLQVPVHPWHGGISARIKNNFFQNPSGILLITPESLQALFCNHGTAIPFLFGDTQYLVIDELHSFIGSERGKQLQTLLFLIEKRAQKNIPRVGLSATLGDMQLAADFLCGEESGRACGIVVSQSNKTPVKLVLKGIEDSEIDAPGEDAEINAAKKVVAYLFPKLHGKNNLVFPNTRGKVELYTHLFSSFCEESGIPNEFFAHHGNLSKEIREEAEASLKSKERRATVICTTTLESGIDIGEIESIVQIETPPSVASLRQRLGRSGRRTGVPAVLRALTIEKKHNERNHPFSQLRENTFSFCACITLLLEGWCEPPRRDGLYLSTLVQQLLSLILECSGILPSEAFTLLCENGPFRKVVKKDFFILIKALIARELVEQDSQGLLLLGDKGEKRAAHFSFYAAFTSQTEYRIVTAEKTLGTLPVNTTIQKNDFLIFAGQTWKIIRIDDAVKVIEVILFGEGRPPVFTGGGWSVHKKIRERMRELYQSNISVPYADDETKRFILEGRRSYHAYFLNNPQTKILEEQKYSVLFTWLGSNANRTLQLAFRHHGWTSYTGGLGLTIPGKKADEVSAFLTVLRSRGLPPAEELLDDSQNICVGKWDWTLPPRLLKANYAGLYLDFDEAREWLAAWS